MTNTNENSKQDQSVKQLDKQQSANRVKKSFVEPEVSPPVDVLEATTFFQAVTSGATN